MRTLLRSLQDHSPALLRAIADVYQVRLVSNVGGPAAEQLAEIIGAPAYLDAALSDLSPQAVEALADLLHGRGRRQLASFERRFGAIRRFGPGRLDREQPQRSPANASEELWYRGLIYRAFDETSDGLVEFLYVPHDLLPLLPEPGPPDTIFEVPTTGPPARVVGADDRLLQDACTLLGLVQSGRVRLQTADDPLSWHRSSLADLNAMLLLPTPADVALDEAGGGWPPALLIALAQELGWLRAQRFRLRLDGAAVMGWLDRDRGEQQFALLDAWRRSTNWNDLCRTPALRCEDTGSWANEPVVGRAGLLALLAMLPPANWVPLDELVAAIKRFDPDFQRRDGNYETWYVRRRDEQTYLRGFQHWDDVEGQLVRYMVAGPLHWLGAVDLGLPAAQDRPPLGTAHSFRITAAGGRWLAGAVAEPSASTPAATIAVLPDFTVLVPAQVALRERFRVARFTTWEASGLVFRYRITQTGLRRAADQGIGAGRVLRYLQEQTGSALPDNVAAALARWQERSADGQPADER